MINFSILEFCRAVSVLPFRPAHDMKTLNSWEKKDSSTNQTLLFRSDLPPTHLILVTYKIVMKNIKLFN